MLKPTSSLLLCDPRQAGITIEDLHAMVQPLQLNEAVPREICDQFDITRHTFVYAWFVYEFSMLAEHQCYFVLEMALRRRLNPDALPNTTRSPGLARLIQVAVDRGLLRREDYQIPDMSGTGASMCGLDMLRQSRNHLEHGNINLVPPFSLMVLRLCASVINHLFESSRAAVMTSDGS